MEMKDTHLETLENTLFAEFASSPPNDTPVIFLLGASRTGSTFLYQALIHRFSLSYFSNLANDTFFNHPIIALALQNQLRKTIDVSFKNQYGKTEGVLQPSEASYVHKNWFGGEHPAQLHSKQILPDKKDHIINTVSAAYHLTQQPCIIKNAWNCFRIESLAELFPQAFFIWIRRDLTRCAISDLATRYNMRTSPTIWNSATPWNYEALQKKPYWEQVVENQYEFNVAISESLAQSAQNRSLEVWYEDLYTKPNEELQKVETHLNGFYTFPIEQNQDVQLQIYESQTHLETPDGESIQAYIKSQHDRLSPFFYQK
ncbi:MAG: sulfotransferase [Candidatus Latescibacteria bacterium]|jgi:hypothetical protein|nr:sulfotransferase [Candidatus Latescibacterota bacterium]MBT4136644.1 sulfotransferase [Candidatus Latescibacterota bacterium]MBT5832726.1 sulfotransferase [Candidatus Latescibacterota bacterium]